jgi:LCP family protein required for cell wall assembly
MRKRRRSVWDLLYFLALLVLILAFLISGLHIRESTVFRKGAEVEEQVERKTVVRDGVEYFPRQDITVMLVMGIDQSGPAVDSGSYRNPGAVDVAMLLIFDEKMGDCSILYLNRDTMVQMPVLGLGGKEAGSVRAQLALAHTYGNGLEESCENTRRTVSDFLNGISIDYYISMRMDAIAMLNDAVGGVTVLVEDDFSQVDSSIPKGLVTLRGEQALNFVRSRKDLGDQLNVSRIERQKTYIQGFTDAFRAAMDSDAEFVVRTYDAVSPYLVTDCSVNTISGLLSRFEGFEIREIVTPAGQNLRGEEYYEFHADEEKLDALILRLFYAPK